MTLENVLGMPGITGIIALVIMGGLWLSLTVGILCIMEVRPVQRAVLWILITPSLYLWCFNV